MADNPKFIFYQDMDSSCDGGAGGGCGGELFEENMETQKISVLDHVNGLQYTKQKSDSFVIDMDSFSHAINKDITANSRITLQRSLSRKGSLRSGSGGGGGGGCGEKKTNSNLSNLSVSDTEATVATSSPRGPSMPETAAVVTEGSTDHSSSPQVHHQITITTGNINSTTEGRRCLRRNSFKRSPPSWVLDPKRVLFVFATLSSMGTVLLIYLTLSIGKFSAVDNSLD